MDQIIIGNDNIRRKIRESDGKIIKKCIGDNDTCIGDAKKEGLCMKHYNIKHPKDKRKSGEIFQHNGNWYIQHNTCKKIICHMDLDNGEFCLTRPEKKGDLCKWHQDNGKTKSKNNKKASTIEREQVFIIESKKLFGDDHFDYSNLNYINRNAKVNIKCLIHQLSFAQTPNSHIKSMYGGCRQCQRA